MATVTPLKQHKQHLTTDQNSEVQRRGPPRSAKSGNSSWTTSMAAADEQMRTPQKLNQQQPCRRVLPSKDSLAPSAIIGSKKRRAMGSGEVGGYSAGFNEDSDLIRNGRALLAATTTTLGTPAEISNKRRRTMADHHNNAHNELTVPATPNKITLRLTLGPKQANGNAAIADPTGGETGSRKQGSTGKRSSKKAQRTKDDERRILQEREALEWKQKYSKAFKSFIFYFDTIEESKKQNAEKCVGALGAKVESFFSKQVTHVITSRQIQPIAPPGIPSRPVNWLTHPLVPSLPIFTTSTATAGSLGPQLRNTSESPVKPSSLNTYKQHDSLSGPIRRSKPRIGAVQSNINANPLKTPPKIKPFASTERTESRDVLVKAQSFGMKIWTLEKLYKMLNRLLDLPSPGLSILASYQPLAAGSTTVAPTFLLPTNGGISAKPSLPSLLRAEALTGSTYERDLSTLRPGYHYFPSKCGYLLVEDSSGEFQPAHAKEFDQRITPRSEETVDRETDWPTLWGGQEGRGAFFKPSSNYDPPLPNLPRSFSPAITERLKDSLEATNIPQNTILRRSVSMNALQKSRSIDGGGLSAPISIQAISQTSGLKAKLDSYQAASGNSQIISSNIASATSTATTRSGQIIGGNLAGARGNTLANGIIVDKRLARLGSKARKHVVTLGRQNNENIPPSHLWCPGMPLPHVTSAVGPGAMKRSLSLDTGLSALKVLKPPKDEPKKPGYCENCRIRYEDFKAHCRSKKHRRFALDINNWLDLDDLFSRIARPILPELLGLYEAAGCEVPSDIEASDASDSEIDEEEEDEECIEIEDDSGYVSRSEGENSRPAKVRKSRKKMTKEDWEKILDQPMPVYRKPTEDEQVVFLNTSDDSEETDSDDFSTSEEEDAFSSEESGDEAAEVVYFA